MYAVVVTVRIEPDRTQEAMDDLASIVVPDSKAAPGFVRGTWCSNQDSGHAMVLFDTREHAEQMAARHVPPPGGAVRIDSIGTFEVRAEA
jgi:quinol monooxygenase YgiN